MKHFSHTRTPQEIMDCRISPDCVAQVIFDSPVTQGAIGKLIAHLELAKDNYSLATVEKEDALLDEGRRARDAISGAAEI